MKVSLLIIGDELLNGRINDLNGSWLAKHLFENNLNLVSMFFVRDDEDQIKNALQNCLDNSDVVITSGGIGPTKDDITKKVVASFFGKDIKENDRAIPIIKNNYKYYDKVWNPDSNSYHLIPDEFIITPNPCGLAPGIGYHDRETNKLVLCAPGVPKEFRGMFVDEFAPRISEIFSLKSEIIQQYSIRTYGIPEEKIFYDLCPSLWDELSKFGKVSSLPQVIGIDILITFLSSDAQKSIVFDKIKKIIEGSALKNNVWQYGDLPIAEYLLELVRNKKLTIAFAESCTGGLAASYMTDIPGSSDFFLGSVVSYSNELKKSILGVKNETLENFGAVSTQTASEMVKGVQIKTNADYVLSFSGIAGPSGGSHDKPVGTVAIGWGKKDYLKSELFQFRGDRLSLKKKFCEFGFLKLIQEITLSSN